MDDGYKTTNGFYIATESYSEDDHLFIIQVLNRKFKLEASAHKTTNGYRLYIPSTSISLRNYSKIHPHFKYKLDIKSSKI